MCNVICCENQDGPTGQLCESKLKHLDNPFIDSSQRQTVVDMKGIFASGAMHHFMHFYRQ